VTPPVSLCGSHNNKSSIRSTDRAPGEGETHSAVDAVSPVEVLVLQPTAFCNIACRYCYVTERSKRQAMNGAVLAGIGSNILGCDLVRDRVLICWHSGEPLTLPPAYYENAFAILRQSAPRALCLEHHVQTNATLVTREWIEFFKRHNVSVSVSLDGPKEIHDSARRQRNGRGTHEAAMRGLSLLNEAGSQPSVICVLTDASLQFPEQLFWFFEQHGLDNVSFNVEELVGANATSSALDRREAFARFLRVYLELMSEHGSRQSVRGILELAASLFQTTSIKRFDSVLRPVAHVSVNVDGWYWTFSPELGFDKDAREFFLGNCCRDSIADAVRSPRFSDLASRIQSGVSLCRQACAYFDICGGGSPAHKYAEARSFEVTETGFCTMNVKIVADVLTDIALRRPSAAPQAV
jgi:uncharacterized protein